MGLKVIKKALKFSALRIKFLSAESEGNEPTLLHIVSQLVECCKMGDAVDDAEKTKHYKNWYNFVKINKTAEKQFAGLNLKLFTMRCRNEDQTEPSFLFNIFNNLVFRFEF